MLKRRNLHPWQDEKTCVHWERNEDRRMNDPEKVHPLERKAPTFTADGFHSTINLVASFALKQNSPHELPVDPVCHIPSPDASI
jgi:hypothetical protein